MKKKDLQTYLIDVLGFRIDEVNKTKKELIEAISYYDNASIKECKEYTK